jgi:hypothetical protein
LELGASKTACPYSTTTVIFILWPGISDSGSSQVERGSFQVIGSTLITTRDIEALQYWQLLNAIVPEETPSRTSAFGHRVELAHV